MCRCLDTGYLLIMVSEYPEVNDPVYHCLHMRDLQCNPPTLVLYKDISGCETLAWIESTI